jgi:hypothetical protein
VPGAHSVVRVFILACHICQKNKTEQLQSMSLLQPFDLPSAVWADIAMDFIEGLPRVNRKSVILTVVDKFSKATHFIPLAHPYTATVVARAFFDNIVRLHDIPCSIVSDRDPVFTSCFWTELFSLTGVNLYLSSAFHPQTDGESEATNKIITMYLRCLTGDRPRQWVQWLPWAEFYYNLAYQASLKMSPFRVVYDRRSMLAHSTTAIAGPGLIPDGGPRKTGAGTTTLQGFLRSQAPRARVPGRRLGVASADPSLGGVHGHQGAQQAGTLLLRVFLGPSARGRGGL